MECIYFIIMVLVLGFIGWVIDLVVPGKMPMGWIGGVIAAIVGGVLGGLLVGQWGPAVTWCPSTGNCYTLSILPAILGGIILGFIVRFVMGNMSGGRRAV